MATLSTKYVDSEILRALLERLNKMYKSLLDYTDSAVENIDYAEYVTDAAYDSESAKINFTNQEGTVVSSIDASDFIKDGMLSGVAYDSSAATLTFTFNTDSGQEDITVDISTLIDVYTAGDGIDVTNNTISAVVSSSSESYLSLSSAGLSVTGIDAIADRVTTVEEWIDENYITTAEVDELFTSLDETYVGFADAAGVTSE